MVGNSAQIMKLVNAIQQLLRAPVTMQQVLQLEHTQTKPGPSLKVLAVT